MEIINRRDEAEPRGSPFPDRAWERECRLARGTLIRIFNAQSSSIILLIVAACCSCSKSPVPVTAGSNATAPVTADEPSAPIAASNSVPFFRNIAPDAGLTAVLYCGGIHKDHILESVGSGVAWIDYDEDGKLDLYFVNAWALDEQPSQVRIKGRNILYRNVGNGRFEDVTQRARVGDDSWGCGVCVGDYDNDGHVDLYITNFGPNKLYRNLGNGMFEEVGEAAGVADEGWGAGASFFDADRDGDLDLYLTNYIDCKFESVLTAERTHVWREKMKVMSGPFGMRGGRDRFYRNNGDGHFTDATDEAGLTDIAESYGLGVVTSDLDDDGDVDVYVANDSNPNFLYRNEGNGSFKEVGTWTGAALSGDGAAQGSMGVEAGDFTGDGLQELIVTNFALDYCTLYQNSGNLFFEDISVKQRLKEFTFTQMSWGCTFFDYDLDADLDLVIANGHIYPQVDDFPDLQETYRQEPLLLQNNAGQLANVSNIGFPGKELKSSQRGLAAGDFDNDGDLDLAVTAIDSPPFLLRNDYPRKGHWLKLRILNQHGSPAIGARAKITAGGVPQMRELRSGSSYQSQNALDLHFGLGEACRVESVEIRWSNGETANETNVEADQMVVIRPPGKK